ncbi:MAG TPA: hypothetical protein VNL77_13975 [Roseiflexaceae bacterium]|nr:hypothetical protein [Roseiflexaceae bacterium]
MRTQRPRIRRRQSDTAAVETTPEPTATLTGLVVEWLASRPVVDRIAAALLRYPRVLMAMAGVLGALLVIGALLPLLAPAAAPRPAAGVASVAASPVTPTPPAAPDAQRAVLAVITSYNQASISAGLLMRPDLLAPYLAPDGEAWMAVQAEYERRQARGETADAALTRWGVLQIQVADDTATVVTQEQWDVVTSVGGEVISSRRGVLTRNAYRLRRSPTAGWLIVSVESMTLVA